MQSQAAHAPAQEPVKVELETFEHGFPDGFGPRWWGHFAYSIAIAFAVFQVAIASWHGFAEPVGARHPCRLPAAFDVRPARQFHRKVRCRSRIVLGGRHRRFPARLLPICLLCRPDPARWRSIHARSRHRHVARDPDLRGHAPPDGQGAADHVRHLPALLVLRAVSAGAAEPSRLRLRPDHRASVVRHRRLLRRADLRLRDLHLPVHPVRLVPRTRRHDPSVQ